MTPSNRETQRIAKLLARAGVASRRDVERMIAAGRIAIDGKVVETPATLLASLSGVTVDGAPIAAPAPTRLFRYHKPAGTLTAERDPGGRATIYDRMPGALPRLIPVGRLDLNTEGLLLLTTDGELKRRLELPATGLERTYRARAYGDVSQAQLEDLMLGVEVDGVRYGPIDANLERRTGANVWIEMTLTEGKNREVRRVLEHLGLRVSRLIRTRYGPFYLGDLPDAEVDEVRQHELVAFRKSIEGKPTAKPVPEGADPAALKAWRRDPSRVARNDRAEPVRTDGGMRERPQRYDRGVAARPDASVRDRPQRTAPRREQGGTMRTEDGPRERGDRPRTPGAGRTERPRTHDKPHARPGTPRGHERAGDDGARKRTGVRPQTPRPGAESEERPANARARRAAAFAAAHGKDRKPTERSTDTPSRDRPSPKGRGRPAGSDGSKRTPGPRGPRGPRSGGGGPRGMR